MKKTEIGIVTLRYNDKGELLESHFEPLLKVDFGGDFAKALQTKLNGKTKEEEIQSVATLTLATWFSTLSKIELADRFTEGGIVSEVLHCEKYDDTNVKECKIKFFFKEIEKSVNPQLN